MLKLGSPGLGGGGQSTLTTTWPVVLGHKTYAGQLQVDRSNSNIPKRHGYIAGTRGMCEKDKIVLL